MSVHSLYGTVGSVHSEMSIGRRLSNFATPSYCCPEDHRKYSLALVIHTQSGTLDKGDDRPIVYVVYRISLNVDKVEL